MCEFIYDVRTTKGKKYSRVSLKNAVALISRHLKNSGLTNEELKIILHNSAMSPSESKGLLRRAFFWICLLGCPRGGEHYNLLIDQFEDTEKGIIFKKFQQKNDQGGLEGNQSTFEIPFPSDIKGKAEPNEISVSIFQ